MAKGPDKIEPIKADFDEVAASLVTGASLTTPPANKTIAGTADSPLRIGGAEIDCYVLEDETRVLSQRGMFKGLGVTRGGPRNENEPSHTGAQLPRFATQKWLQPFISNDLEVALKNPILFQPPTGHTGYGYPAERLVDICDAIIEADRAGTTTERQQTIVDNSLALIRSFAKVGIVALVDEATGYQEKRESLALQKILDKFLDDEKRKWTKTFPDEFWQKLVKVKGHDSYIALNRPSYVGHWVNDIVYSRLAPGIKEKLSVINPRKASGNREGKHHQHLTEDHGLPELKDHLKKVMVLMDASSSKKEFEKLLNKSLPKYGSNLELPYGDET